MADLPLPQNSVTAVQEKKYFRYFHLSMTRTPQSSAAMLIVLNVSWEYQALTSIDVIIFKDLVASGWGLLCGEMQFECNSTKAEGGARISSENDYPPNWRVSLGVIKFTCIHSKCCESVPFHNFTLFPLIYRFEGILDSHYFYSNSALLHQFSSQLFSYLIISVHLSALWKPGLGSPLTENAIDWVIGGQIASRKKT